MPTKTSSRNKKIYFDDDVSEEEISSVMALHEGEENLLDFHRSNLENPLVDEMGSTTIYITGVTVDGKIYAVPGYDRDTRTRMTGDQAREKWMPKIRENPNYFPHHSTGEEHNKWAGDFHHTIETTTE